MNKKIYKKLIEVAKNRKLITYSELNEQCGLGFDFSQSKDRAELGELLGEISKFEVDNGRPMISALVVFKDSHPPAPSDGFYKYADELGVREKNEDYKKFFYRQITACHEYWNKK